MANSRNSASPTGNRRSFVSNSLIPNHLRVKDTVLIVAPEELLITMTVPPSFDHKVCTITSVLSHDEVEVQHANERAIIPTFCVCLEHQVFNKRLYSQYDDDDDDDDNNGNSYGGAPKVHQLHQHQQQHKQLHAQHLQRNNNSNSNSSSKLLFNNRLKQLQQQQIQQQQFENNSNSNVSMASNNNHNTSSQYAAANDTLSAHTTPSSSAESLSPVLAMPVPRRNAIMTRFL